MVVYITGEVKEEILTHSVEASMDLEIIRAASMAKR